MSEQEPDLGILIVYYSRFGTVKTMAQRVAEGVGEVPGVVASFLPIEDQPIEQLRPGESEDDMKQRRSVTINKFVNAEALILGSPAYFGNMASPLKRLFEDCVTASDPPATDRSRPWRRHLFSDKIGAAFTSSGTPHGGNELTLHSMLTMMMHLGMILVTPGQQEPILENEAAPYGATAVTGPGDQLEISDEDQARARDLGRRVAHVTWWTNQGRREWERLHEPQAR